MSTDFAIVSSHFAIVSTDFAGGAQVLTISVKSVLTIGEAGAHDPAKSPLTITRSMQALAVVGFDKLTRTR